MLLHGVMPHFMLDLPSLMPSHQNGVLLQDDELEDGTDSEASAHGDEDDDAEDGSSKAKKAKAPAKKAVLKFSLGSKAKGSKAEKVSCIAGAVCGALHQTSHT